MVNMADLSSDEGRQVHKDIGSGEKRKTGEVFTVDFGDMKSKEGKKNLQESFIKFKKQRQKELRDEKRLRERCLRKQGDVEHMNKLRKKFVKRAKKYFGIPYARKYWKPDQPEYKSHLFLDCCGLVRQVMRDLRKDFGFRLGPWNQAYMFDLLPIVVEREEDMKPGDLVFISGTYPRPNARQQKHLMTHVEIWAGDGNKTIGARWNNGKVQVWDDYRFEAKSFVDAKYHFRSLDTWLQGICRSFCSEHKWRRTFTPSKKSIFSLDEDKNKEKDKKPDRITKTKQDSFVPMTASPQSKDEDLEEQLLEEEMEDDEEVEPACDSEEEDLDSSPLDPNFLMLPHNVSGKVKYNGSSKWFPQRLSHPSDNNTPLNGSDEESEDEELSIDSKMASLSVNDMTMTKLGRLNRSQTDLVSGRSIAESQRLQSHSVQEFPTRFPVIVNDVNKAKPSYRNGYERIKHLSDRCLASPRNSVPTKQETSFKTKKKSMEEKRRIFSGLEQSRSVLLIDNDSDEDISDFSKDTYKSISDDSINIAGEKDRKLPSDEKGNVFSDDHFKLPLGELTKPQEFLTSCCDDYVKLPLDEVIVGPVTSPDDFVLITKNDFDETDIKETFNEDDKMEEDDMCQDVCYRHVVDDSNESSENEGGLVNSVQTEQFVQRQDEEFIEDEEKSSQGDHVVTN
ncbi:otolith matrix protein OMM-64-like [Ylistrum balloti]|uniref:otolith matrix protein OMM-64-like n=1 Tax=Ylistrum balloti TaxID=509963 RepID=UPI002905BC8C|nr:otolith matrix protein OMM-64-like [Ylistrum balloti]